MLDPRIISFALIASTLSAPGNAQSPRECQAAWDDEPGPGNVWPALSEFARGHTDSISALRMVARLVGRYALLEVTTEGDLGKLAILTDLTLRSRPLPARREIGKDPFVIAYADGIVAREGYLHAPRSAARSGRKRFFRISYEPPARLVLTETDPANPDITPYDNPSRSLVVLDADSMGGLKGRWTAGGFSVPVLDSWAGKLVEGESGYFCAWRSPE